MDQVEWDKGKMVLYMDNGYNSVRLTQELANHNIRLCGTIQSTRMGLSRDEKTQLNDLQKKDFKVVRSAKKNAQRYPRCECCHLPERQGHETSSFCLHNARKV
ncbi:PiggyBac_transposable element-derived protein [Hexamita inflata]|uniref:PiggyBac transposable element-derived protein n=1 Tax=Hexamita inflata TaxID=28002 RepID=A0AA86UTT7_9EUKA|nr:PiggyBac transposable element-derived protein [Hexamita inflata]